MPSYMVMLSGRGISIPSEPDPVTGFYTTRQVRAANVQEAEVIAKQLILAEWDKDGEYAEVNDASLPELEIEEVQKLSLYESFFRKFPRRGYTFYQKE